MSETATLLGKVIPVGGRIKAAGAGLGHLFSAGEDPVVLHEHLADLRKNPPTELLEAFFPGNRARLRQMMESVGFYRPSLKTDQGMGGNFLEFRIDPFMTSTDLSPLRIVRQEGCLIPEGWQECDPVTLCRARKAFLGMDLGVTAAVLASAGGMDGRQAQKGRLPFFLVRPAAAERIFTIGSDVVQRVELEVGRLASQIADAAAEAERSFCGRSTPPNLIYFQADAYILSDGSVHVERVHCPDLGFFLRAIDPGDSSMLPSLRDMMGFLLDRVGNQIVATAGKKIAIVTRDEVLQRKEDVLELMEIRVLTSKLQALGCEVSAWSVSQVGDIPAGGSVLLLNVDYSASAAQGIFQRCSRRDLNFFPNPFFQQASARLSGLRSVTFSGLYYAKLIELIRAHPQKQSGVRDIMNRISGILAKADIRSDILHADTGTETVPVFAKSLHSWNQLFRRISKGDAFETERSEVTFREIPASPQNLILFGPTGPRLHVLRFMFC